MEISCISLRCVSLPVLWTLIALSLEGSVQGQAVANFVSLQPCRLVDTRDTNRGLLGTPALVGMAQREFAILSGSCNVPTNATAYSLNVTVVPHEPFSYLTVWPTGQTQPLVSTLNAYAGTVTANSALVPAGTSGKISVFVTGDTDLIIDISGYFAPPSTLAVDQLTQSMAQAQQQVTSVITGVAQAAQQITSLQQQVAAANALIAQTTQQITSLQQQVTSANSGSTQATQQITSLQQQVSTLNGSIGQVPSLVTTTNQILSAVGIDSVQQDVALGSGTSLVGFKNSSIGNRALQLNSNGNSNTAIGSEALALNTTGNNNVALGANVLSGNQTGSGNIAVGYRSGSLIGSGDNVIEIGNLGQVGDTAVIRIGTQGVQQTAYMAGVYQSGVDPYGVSVMIDETGMLGTFQSSIRYKEDVRDIGIESDKLMHLRPVQFRYKKPSKKGDKPIQYGLIAEEVQAVFPSLVVHDSQGRIETVQYHQLPALLLSELQKQHQQIEEQGTLIKQQGDQIRLLIEKLGVTTTK